MDPTQKHSCYTTTINLSEECDLPNYWNLLKTFISPIWVTWEVKSSDIRILKDLSCNFLLLSILAC